MGWWSRTFYFAINGAALPPWNERVLSIPVAGKSNWAAMARDFEKGENPDSVRRGL
jgi:hypothetical protein